MRGDGDTPVVTPACERQPRPDATAAAAGSRAAATAAATAVQSSDLMRGHGRPDSEEEAGPAGTAAAADAADPWTFYPWCKPGDPIEKWGPRIVSPGGPPPNRLLPPPPPPRPKKDAKEIYEC